MAQTKPRVRFAPSPTGQLHLGGARTALFNWLFAKHNQGTFLLRIEDTDLQRSKSEYTEQICESLQWLGLNWDENIIYQSQRSKLYKDAIDNLLENGNAYRCFATKDELNQYREKDGSLFYPGLWRDCSEKDIQNKLDSDTPFTIRLKTPNQGSVSFQDEIYGQIKVQASEIDDFIIARSDGTPVYNLVVVIDDHDMKIS
ncbi:MAG: glutamate--tRNA ligase, partial [Candidatus Marinimicrobia bacterium]|nr:glutamate--tRNA ligase [Candidatus Neomarinimicrobiota bacterium]MBT5356072.1 glutamate--tRNA ligase [Candidatus Neomarinimicrobiota bacterium]MBT7358757.1 glutamate--tRNA ligase [Candidatus Neomarinimicrobiota bacterium]